MRVPNVTGGTLDAARDVLKSHGLSVGAVSKQPSRQAAGTVVSQSPVSGEVDEGSSVDLVIAEEEKAKDSKSGKKDSAKSDASEEKTPTKQGETSKSR